jgi:hypothetical protein
MLENRVQMTLGCKGEEMTELWRKLGSKEPHVYCSPEIDWAIKWKKIKETSHVALVGSIEMHTGF